MTDLPIVGLTFTKVSRHRDEIHMLCSDGRTFRLWHNQDCCEEVHIEDINGELSWLENTPILSAYHETSDPGDDDGGLQMWTFYRITTFHGTVVLRWYGESNGFYSVSVKAHWVGEEYPGD